MRPNKQAKWNREQSQGRTFTGRPERPSLAPAPPEGVSRGFAQSAQRLASSCGCAAAIASWSLAAVCAGGTAWLAAGKVGSPVGAWAVVLFVAALADAV